MELPKRLTRFATAFGCLVLLLPVYERLRAAPATNGVIVEWEGSLLYSPAGQPERPAVAGQALNAGDRIRTLGSSRATVRYADLTVFRMRESSSVQVDTVASADGRPALKIDSGAVFFFSRQQPTELRFQTAQGSGVAVGTEFEILTGGRTLLSVYDGAASFTNTLGATAIVFKQEQGIITESSIQKVRLEAKNTVQWWLYYPGVLGPRELKLPPNAQSALAASVQDYERGNLIAAVKDYPANRVPESDNEKAYRAQLFLAVGNVAQATELLDSVPLDSALGNALRTLIAAVSSNQPPAVAGQTASEQLANSYWLQSQRHLPEALSAASNAVEQSPRFGFALARVAELQFGQARTSEAIAALERSLESAPDNAQSHALKGFLLAARNRISAAVAEFDRAIVLDGALANGWLGRGLCRIRMGDAQGGREDLQQASLLEANRSLLRSYLGKAFGNAGDNRHARKDLNRARDLDPDDPTPWLYTALLDFDENRIGDSVDALEKSMALNDNRALYRSELLLDEDRAVRSVSLASVYQRAGMTDVSVREAARAVSYDYANYSAHLFLSDSYDVLRDPTRFNLRYETVWFNELLLANLLSPVGGTPLSQHISQQEYVRLFDENRVGLTSSSEYRSDGEFHQLASQFGNIGNTGWSLDLDYHHNQGIRVNNDLDSIEWYSTIKQQLTPQDSVLVLTKYQDYHSGDNFQYFDPTNARPHFRYDETQTPLMVGGFHHEWQPGVHTLILGGRLENDQQFSDKQTPVNIVHEFGAQQFGDFDNLDVTLRSRLEIFTAEAQQIVQNEWQTFVAGGRWQGGDFHTDSLQNNPAYFNGDTNRVGAFPPGGVQTNTVANFEWLSGYVYETIKLPLRLDLSAGVAYERMEFPVNFRAPPIQGGSETRDRWNPKAGLVWQFLPEATLRGIYARSLGGVSLDESFRLEPTQLSGFPQSFRTIIPESLVGSVSAPVHQIGAAALDLKFPSRTYIGFAGEVLSSDVDRTIGLFEDNVGQPFPNISPTSTKERLRYEETHFRATFNQLVSDNWSLGGGYSFIHSELKTALPAFTDIFPPSDVHANLHVTGLYLLYNHPSGFFAEGSWDWYFQTDSRVHGIAGAVSDQSVNELNLIAGLRFPRQRGDLTIGGLNLLGEDYHLNPVTPYAELPRKCVFYVRLRFRF